MIGLGVIQKVLKMSGLKFLLDLTLLGIVNKKVKSSLLPTLLALVKAAIGASVKYRKNSSKNTTIASYILHHKYIPYFHGRR